jgi:pimeloyl-ACP methyl ester carboxylesterase
VAQYTEPFIDFANRYGYVVLAPLFSAAFRYQDLGVGRRHRADLRLLELVEEVTAEHGLNGERFDLFGYSGGAQFAHRFLYLHAGRLHSVVIGAPGTITVPSRRYAWPAGLGGLEEGKVRVDLEAIDKARVLLIVGDDDVTLENLNQSEQAMRFGTTRLGRARALHAAWQVAGIDHEYMEVPDTGHGLDERFTGPIQRFLAEGLEAPASAEGA